MCAHVSHIKCVTMPLTLRDLGSHTCVTLCRACVTVSRTCVTLCHACVTVSEHHDTFECEVRHAHALQCYTCVTNGCTQNSIKLIVIVIVYDQINISVQNVNPYSLFVIFLNSICEQRRAVPGNISQDANPMVWCKANLT